eukprot:TRINITY_DN3702_c9_g1_i2.p1 TRINITY_DN3702_c9_g1~~TRINITY_DN3702_c9_g1_i2.p1  ORF type:complete len:238 (+),score=18.98 TRINITY_DN3702_c9_g1_i2:37-750(+)
MAYSSTSPAAPLSVSSQARGVPDWYQGEGGKDKVNDAYEGGIYQPPPLIKNLLGYVRYHLAPRASYDENQRKYDPEVEALMNRSFNELSFIEKMRYYTSFRAGLPAQRRPFPWKDTVERSGFCPDMHRNKEWKYPRRTMRNKYVPPPKDGVYEDPYHVREHFYWAYREWMVWRFEIFHSRKSVIACYYRHQETSNIECRDLIDLHYNLSCKTNNDKVKMMVWSGIPVVKDGGFAVQY